MYGDNVLLPGNAKYFGFIDSKSNYNPHWDIVWSFSYTLSGSEHAFCTFLSNSAIPLSSNAGHYMGILSNSTVTNPSVLSIAFDSTGYFGLSNSYNSGLLPSSIKRNSLTIRDKNGIIFHSPLSSLASTFALTGSNYKTLRFRLADACKSLHIDYKTDITTYQNLTSVSITGINVNSYGFLYPGFTYCSPISSLTNPSTLKLKNFHVQGILESPTYEVFEYSPYMTISDKPVLSLSSVY